MKKTLIASAVFLAASGAQAEWTSQDGSLTIGGNVEINTDYVDVDRGKASPTGLGVKDGGRIADDSRFLLDVQWLTRRGEYDYITAKAQPLIRTDGTVAIDDSYLALGQEKMWEFQIGRFEAMELFSTGKDTVAYIAAGADTIGQGVYYYKGHEGRGRRDMMGQARIGGQAGNWSFEISSAYGDAADMLAGSKDYLTAHGYDATDFQSDDNSFVIRPAINFTSDSGFFSLSLGAEHDVSNGKVFITDGNGKIPETSPDLSKRTGFAGKIQIMPNEDLAIRLSAAHQTIEDVWKVNHVNLNFEYKIFGAGISMVKNERDDKVLDALDKLRFSKDSNSYVAYAAVTLPIMSFDNATLTLGASYSETENAYSIKNNKEKTGAVRARINYYF